MSEPDIKPHDEAKPDQPAPGDVSGVRPEDRSDWVKLTPEQEAARQRRNRAIALGLVAFIALIFVTTMVRLTSNYNMGG